MNRLSYYFLSIVILIFVFKANAKEVNINKAREVAKNFYYLKTFEPNSPRTENVSVKNEFVIKSNVSNYKTQQALIYIFNFDSNGFVIVSADDKVIPVLGYSEEGNYDNTNPPPSFNWIIETYKKQIDFIKKKNVVVPEEIKEAWKMYETKSAGILKNMNDVSPLLSTTWDQDCYYNESCPTDAAAPWYACGHVFAGCVATTMGQIMKYHAHPTQGTGSHTYTHPTYGTQTVNFANETYNWSAMPNSINSSNSAIATLLYDCAVAVDMDFGTDGSGAYSGDAATAFVNYFNYSPSTQLIMKNNYTDANWKSTIVSELDASRPIFYRGENSAGSSGHAFVCDGYQGTDYFHFNFGWSGSYNGYFYLSSLSPSTHDFTYDQGAIIGISPSTSPYCAAGSNQCDEYVSNVNLNTISNSSTCGTGGYTDYMTISTDLEVSNSYTINITNGSPYSGDQCGVWIDWNQDNDFDDANESVTISGGNTNYSGTVSVPSSAILGNTRMRVRISYGGTLSPCGSSSYGEVEDYSINVINNTPVITYTSTQVSCFGLSDGGIDLTILNGVPPFSYVWSGANGFSSNLEDISNLVAGNYFVTVTDNNLVSVTENIAISEPLSISLTFSIDEITNLGGSDGGVNLTVTGGFFPYTYLWSNGETTQNLVNISAGTYSVTVSDYNSCTEVGSVVVADGLNVLNPPSWTFTNTGSNHTVLIANTIDISINNIPIENGDYIGVFYDSLGELACGGFLIWAGANDALTVWGEYLGNDGFVTGEEFVWKIWDVSSSTEYFAEASYQTSGFPNTNTFSINGISALASLTVTTYSPDWTFSNTGNNHTILLQSSIPITIDGEQISIGDYLGVFYDSLGTLACGGFHIWQGATDAITAWGEYLGNDGFVNGEIFKWKLFDVSTGEEYTASATYFTSGYLNTNTYAINGISGLSSLVANTSEIHTINLVQGWSIFSTYINPTDPSIDFLMNSIVSEVIIVKNGVGSVYYPQFGVNLIGNISIGEAYQIKTNSAQILEIEGVSVVPENTAVNLPLGWSILGYLRNNSAPIATMLNTISPNIEIVKNGLGQVYYPQYGVNLIGNMNPGEGYQIKMNLSDILYYPAN